MEVLNQRLKGLIAQLEQEIDLVDPNRMPLLDTLKQAVFELGLHPVFICTHNSRRSQLAEVWVHVLAKYYNKPVMAYSGGTEATAFNPRMVKALRDMGFELNSENEMQNNPHYSLYKDGPQLFSKTFDDAFNPQAKTAAVMVCSDADENCPVVLGAEKRIPLRYEDPKEFDGTELEEQAYLNKVIEIGREMIYLFKSS